MNPSSHYPIAVETTPCRSSTKGARANQFNLRMQYRPGGDFQNFIGVYIPENLQPAVLSGDIAGLHIDTLEVNSLASRILPGGPSYVVLGIRSGNGEELRHVPAAYTSARLVRQVFGAAACMLGCGLLASAQFVWCGAFALVIGTHALRSARQIPCCPFRVYTAYR